MGYEIIVRFLVGLLVSGAGMMVVTMVLLAVKSVGGGVFSAVSYANVLLGVDILGIVLPIGAALLPTSFLAAMLPYWWAMLLCLGVGAGFLLAALLRKNKRAAFWQAWMEDYPGAAPMELAKELAGKLSVKAPDKIMLCTVAGTPMMLRQDAELLMLLPHIPQKRQDLEFTIRRLLCQLRFKEKFRSRLAFFVTLVYWWNPFSWVLYWNTLWALSCAVDQLVVADVKDKDAYTVFAAKALSQEKLVTTAPLTPAFQRKRFIRQRLRSLLSGGGSAGASGAVFLLLAILYGGGVYALNGVLAGSTVLTTPPPAFAAEPLLPTSSTVSMSEPAASEPAASSEPLLGTSEPAASQPLLAASEPATSESAVSQPLLAASESAASSEPLLGTSEPAASQPLLAASEPVSGESAAPETVQPVLTLPEYPDFPEDLKNQLQGAFQKAADTTGTVTEAFTQLLTQPPLPEYVKTAGALPPKELVAPILEEILQSYREGTVDTTTTTPRMTALPFSPEELPAEIDPQTYFVTTRATDAYGIVLTLANGWMVHIWLDDLGDEVTYDLQVVAVSFAAA